MEPDVSVVIIFHDEQLHSLAALDSMKDNIDVARAEGLVLEARAILDNADDRTRDLVRRRGQWLDATDEVSFTDLGLTRNAAVAASKGKFIAFLDGDDLWGGRWVLDAYRCATAMQRPAIWHPEYVYYFDEDGFNQYSTSSTPHPHCRAIYGVHIPSDSADFDRRSLIFANAWTANAMASRQIHLRFPYDRTDLSRGIGFEDWGWNIKTISSGIPHLVVKSTIHAIRRTTTSLSVSVHTSGGLPIFHSRG